MTIENLENISQKDEQVGDERAPLLSTSQDEEAGYSKFHGASFHGSVFNWSCTVVGSGIMSLPATLKVLGLVLGVALIILAAFLTEASIDMLLRFSNIGDAFGKIGKVLLQVCVIINNIGVLIVYLIIIEDVLSVSTLSGVHHSGILEEWFGEHWWTGCAFVLIVLTLVIFVSFDMP